MTDSAQPSTPAPAAPHYRLTPGPSATIADLRAAQQRDLMLRSELPRVREAATAWRNGLGALLASVIGFGLIKGRTDVRELASPYAVAVGALLAAALVAGAFGALLLIRAAHGRPTVSDVTRLPPGQAGDHIEALASATALHRGIRLTLTCALLLVAAVGTTWYGPPRSKPAIRVATPTGTVCGSVVRLDHAVLVLKTDAGEVSADLSSASTINAVDKCP